MALTRQEEYIAHWLQKRGSITLRSAEQKGISKASLDALVAVGIAEFSEDPHPSYKIASPEKLRRTTGQARDPRSVGLVQPLQEKKNLTARQKEVAAWLDRAGKVTLQKAKKQGIAQVTLEALVKNGRAERIEEPELGYRSTSAYAVDPSSSPAIKQTELPTVVRVKPSTPLNSKQKYALRWLDRRGQCTPSQIQGQGIETSVFEDLVKAGYIEFIEDPYPLYRTLGQARHYVGRQRDPGSKALEITTTAPIKVLTAREDYVARWLDRAGQVSLRWAMSQGIEKAVLDVLVRYGRARYVPAPDPIYQTTADPGVVPDTAPVEPPASRRDVIVKLPATHLTRKQEYVARWLRRSREVSLSTARQRGMDQEVLDVLVDAGLVERIESGNDPIYRSIEAGARLRKGPEAIPRIIPKPLPVPIDQQIVNLLSDGIARSPAEIASALIGATDFVAMRQVGRDVQRALPGLVSREHLQKVSIGFPVDMSGRRTYSYEEKYVAANSVVHICLSCFKNHWSMDAVPPQTVGDKTRLCSFPDCRKRINDAAYVPKKEFEKRLSGALVD